MIAENKGPWTRLHDDPQIPAVAAPSASGPAIPGAHRARYCPISRAELIQIIKDAEQAPDPKPEVRACGSHWALSDAALTHGVFVETHDPDAVVPDLPTAPRLDSTLFEVIPKCMTPVARRFFYDQAAQGPTKDQVAFKPTAIPNPDVFYLYHVEAGMRIYELYCLLGSGDDREADSLARRIQADFNRSDYMGPWAMPTLGGAGGQTIVGAFTTGTHGSDIQLAPIADAVQAIHLIGPEGKEYWIERELAPGLPMVDDDLLHQQYPRIEIRRDLDLLHAVMVSVGRMGIIYSVVLRVVRQYGLAETRSKDVWSSAKSWVANPFHPNFTSNRFVQVVVNPVGQEDNASEHNCYTSLRNLVLGNPDGTFDGQKERCGANAGHSVPFGSNPSSLFNLICMSDSPAKAAVTSWIHDLEDTRDSLLEAAGVLTFIGDISGAGTALAAASLVQTAISALYVLFNSLPSGPLGLTLGAIAKWAEDNDRMEVLRRIDNAVIENAQDPSSTPKGVSYAIMDNHNYLDVGCEEWGDSLEVFFDFTTVPAAAAVVDYVDALLSHVRELENGWLTGKKAAFLGYISLRFMSQTAALIGMQKWGRVCSLEIAGLGGVDGTEEFLKVAEQDAITRGAAVHWGQRNHLTMKQVEATYGDLLSGSPLSRWRKALSDLSANGRLATFSTEFTRHRGLEVVQPILKSFTVSPTHACAGSPVTITWHAVDNPPGTTARMEVWRPGNSTPLDVMPLAALDGVQDVTLPSGMAELRLVVAHQLNGRTLTAEQGIQVHGFRDHEIWSFNLQAVCVQVGGAMRWGAEISLWSTVSTQLAVEEIFCYFNGAPKWWLQRAGIPNLPFSPATMQQPTPSLPSLQGDWLFYVDTPGCSGTPPNFHLDFRLICNA